VRVSEDSSQEEKPTEKDESQKLQTRTLDGNTAPHCEHVFVTGAFCAADASTPVRRERSKDIMPAESQVKNGLEMWRIRQQEAGGRGRGEPLSGAS
jgi:hypothetical protein